MKAQIVSFHCVLKNKMGRVISSTFNHDVLTQVENSKAPLPGLAQGLRDLKSGEKRMIALSAREAYGFYDPSKVITRSLDEFPKDRRPHIGERIFLREQDNDKSASLMPYLVTEIGADTVTLDGNHPLAGQDLVFEIEAISARDATAEEIFESSHSPDQAKHLIH